MINEVRDKVHEAVPLVDIEFVQLLQDMLGDLEGNPEPIEVKIFGNDPQRLAELAEPVEEMLNKVQGVVDVVGVQKGNPEVTWTIDPIAAERYGLTVAQVSDQLAGNWLGEVRDRSAAGGSARAGARAAAGRVSLRSRTGCRRR